MEIRLVVFCWSCQ